MATNCILDGGTLTWKQLYTSGTFSADYAQENRVIEWVVTCASPNEASLVFPGNVASNTSDPPDPVFPWDIGKPWIDVNAAQEQSTTGPEPGSPLLCSQVRFTQLAPNAVKVHAVFSTQMDAWLSRRRFEIATESLESNIDLDARDNPTESDCNNINSTPVFGLPNCNNWCDLTQAQMDANPTWQLVPKQSVPFGTLHAVYTNLVKVTESDILGVSSLVGTLNYFPFLTSGVEDQQQWLFLGMNAREVRIIGDLQDNESVFDVELRFKFDAFHHRRSTVSNAQGQWIGAPEFDALGRPLCRSYRTYEVLDWGSFASGTGIYRFITP